MKKKLLGIGVGMSVLMMNIAFAATSYPTIMNTLKTSLTKIQEWLIVISTPAAAIAVITGLLIKKFSFGDTERMMVGRRLVRTSFISYGMILSIDLILKAIATFVGKK